jgi:hypothetical protein
MLARTATTLAVALVAVEASWSQWNVVQEAKLGASDAGPSDSFGSSVAVDDVTALVGADGADNENGADAGAAYVYVRSGMTWIEQQRLMSDQEPNAGFGRSVALQGDTAVVGAPFDDVGGSAFVFLRSGSAWSPEQKLNASSTTIADRFGTSVAISGETVVVGAELAGSGLNEKGAAYVFVRSGTTWTEQAVLKASDGAEPALFGCSVAIEGDTVLVGARQDNGAGVPGAGSVYVFVRSGTIWTEHQKLTASDAGFSEFFGWAVALSGETALIGAPWHDHPGFFEAGAGYVFVRTGTTWTEHQKLAASNPESADHLGVAVALSGNLAIIGAAYKAPQGAAYLFVRSGTLWSEQVQIGPSIPEETGLFGNSVGISVNTALVGAEHSNGGHVLGAGAAYVERLSMEPQPYCTAGTSASGCRALLSASGAASATVSSGFTLLAASVEGQKDGLFFFGTNGRQANSWGNGTSYQCVAPPVVRASLMNGTGTTGMCNGALVQDLNALWCPTCAKPAKNPGSGALVQAQLWYRDPSSTSNQTTSLSDAIEFLVGP